MSTEEGIRMEIWAPSKSKELKLNDKYTLIYTPCEKPEVGFVGRCKERGGAIAQSETIEGLKNDMLEILDTLDDMDRIDAIQEPKEVRELINEAHTMIIDHNKMIAEDPKIIKTNPSMIDLGYIIKKAYSIGVSEK